MLPGLGLGALLVGRDDQYGAVHHGGPAEHGGHEYLVAGGVHEAHGPLKLGVPAAGGALLGHAVALGLLAVGALVDCSVGVAQLYGDASLELLAVAAGPLSCEGLDEGGLAVVYVAYGANVDLRLAR